MVKSPRSAPASVQVTDSFSSRSVTLYSATDPMPFSSYDETPVGPFSVCTSSTLVTVTVTGSVAGLEVPSEATTVTS